MSYRAEDSYYTPDGIINKSSYNSYSAKAKSKSVNADSITKKAKSTVTNNPIWSNLSGSGSSASTSKKNSYKDSRKKLITKYASGLILFILIAFFFAVTAGDDYDDYGSDSYDEYNYDETIYPNITVDGDGYSFKADEVLYGTDYDSYLYAYIYVDVTGKNDIDIDPYQSINILFNGEQGGELSYVNVYTDDYQMDNTFYESGEKMTLKADTKYIVSISYNSLPDWEDVTIIHNFHGSLVDRDLTSDITVNKVGESV